MLNRRGLLKMGGLLAVLPFLNFNHNNKNKLTKIFEEVDNALCQSICQQTNHIVWTLHGCWKDKERNSPVRPHYHYSSGIKNKYRSITGFYCSFPDSFFSKKIRAHYDLPYKLTYDEEQTILKMFADKYKATVTAEDLMSESELHRFAKALELPLRGGIVV